MCGVAMRLRGRAVALLAGAAVTIATGVVLVPSVRAAESGPVVMVVCTAPAWAEGNTYAVGDRVTYNGRLYEAMVAHTAWPGAGWNPAATPSLWKDLGACDGQPPTSPSPTRSPSRPPSASPTPSRTTAPPTSRPPSSPPPTGATCPVKSRPGGKVLQGYWENWDGA